jgi:hypothetical protein
MCTVTYIPLPGVRFMTSNRDESLRDNLTDLSLFTSPTKKQFIIRLMKNQVEVGLH